jgi:Spy/CpxP family protein refolding chaperone
MKTWIKRTLIAAVGVSVLLGGAAAFAHRHSGWHSMSAGDITQAKTRMVDRIAERMTLDATQKAKLGVLADQLLAQRTALMAGGDPRAAMQALVAGPAFDRAGAQALLDAKTDVVRAGAPAVIAAFGDFYDSLQPEQQTQLRELMNRRHSEGEGKGHRGEQRGGARGG